MKASKRSAEKQWRTLKISHDRTNPETNGYYPLGHCRSIEKGKRQNRLREDDIEKIVDTYQFRCEELRYSRRVTMEEIETNGYNLNISRYISTAQHEAEVDLQAVHGELVEIEQKIVAATRKHNEFLRELGLPFLPMGK